MSRTLSWDDDHCPSGHGSWVFVPASTLYSDIYWCPGCDVFYQPTVKKFTKEKLNEEFSSDRAGAIIKRAEFIRWKSDLAPADMERMTPPNNTREEK